MRSWTTVSSAFVEVNGAQAVSIPFPGVIGAWGPAAIGYPMNSVLAGTYALGCVGGETERGEDEVPRRVVLTRAFLMGVTEVTQGQFAAVMGENPAYFVGCGPDCPVEQVDWVSAVRFANALSEMEGYPPCYRVLGDAVA